MERIKIRNYKEEYDIYYLKNKRDTYTPVGHFTSCVGKIMHSRVPLLNARIDPTVLSPIKTAVQKMYDNKKLTQFDIMRHVVAVNKKDKSISEWVECKITAGDKKLVTGWCCLDYLR